MGGKQFGQFGHVGRRRRPRLLGSATACVRQPAEGGKTPPKPPPSLFSFLGVMSTLGFKSCPLFSLFSLPPPRDPSPSSPLLLPLTYAQSPNPNPRRQTRRRRRRQGVMWEKKL